MSTLSKKYITDAVPAIAGDNHLVDKIFKMLKGLVAKSSDHDVMAWFDAYVADPSIAAKDLKLTWVEKAISKYRDAPKAPAALNANIPFRIYGETLIEKNAIEQMYNLLQLPIAVAGALMPDAHLGYGIPIGGVAATHKDYVIPYAVGSDISCMMSLSIFNVDTLYMEKKKSKFLQFLKEKTYFGKGCTNDGDIVDDSILHLDEWKDLPMYAKIKNTLVNQLGTSGSGNHFVDWGYVTFDTEYKGIPKGKYVALMTHSGSRGVGYNIADYYTKKAKEKCTFLDKSLLDLSWLDLNTDDGKEYWKFMNMAGQYASACHNEIHLKAETFMGEAPLLKVENYHNFCWQEEYDGNIVNVHRKGATPAQNGVIGIIPGSMATPAYIVEGMGSIGSINSASHGSGRVMGRNQAKKSITSESVDIQLKKAGITLIGGGLDEAPKVYKNIDDVMSFQTDLVSVKGVFTPKYVRMADDGSHED